MRSASVATQAPPTQPEAEAVVSKACIRAADILGLTQATLGRVLGLSAASISRLYAGSFTLPNGGKSYELALLLIRLFRGLDAMLNEEEGAMRSWMLAPNLALGGVPLTLITTVTGLVDTVAYVDSARARI